MGNIVNQLTQGLKDGAAVVAGQVAVRKLRGAVTGMLPAAQQAQVKAGPGYVALATAGALAVSLGARKLIPSYARMVTAGAFAEAINCALAQTPVAPYLGAFPPRRVARVAPAGAGGRGVNAWPGARALPAARAAGVNAWPAARTVGLPMNAGM